MDLKQVKKTVARLKSSLFKNANAFSVGMLRSHFRGTGLQFKEHQVYIPGDDVRFLDWKILAKNKEPHIKTFEEERNVEIVVMLDVSITMFSGDNGISKLQAAIEICCLLFLLADQTSDYIQVIIVGEEIISLPKMKGEMGVVSLIYWLQKQNILDGSGLVNLAYFPKKRVDHRQKNKTLMKYLAKKKELVILSDFNDFLDVDMLKKMLIRSNVHCFQIISPLDEAEKFPFMIFAATDITEKNGNWMNVNFYRKEELKGPLGKKFKKLRVHGRYLEEFVKEML